MEKVFDVEMLDIRYLPGANRMTQIKNGDEKIKEVDFLIVIKGNKKES